MNYSIRKQTQMSTASVEYLSKSLEKVDAGMEIIGQKSMENLKKLREMQSEIVEKDSIGLKVMRWHYFMPSNVCIINYYPPLYLYYLKPYYDVKDTGEKMRKNMKEIMENVHNLCRTRDETLTEKNSIVKSQELEIENLKSVKNDVR